MRSHAIKSLYPPLLLTIVALAVAPAAFSQVPSANDTSDTNFNTGMGTRALGGPAASNAGVYNTASGYQALYSNTTGYANTALGLAALYYNTTGSVNTALGLGALNET